MNQAGVDGLLEGIGLDDLDDFGDIEDVASDVFQDYSHSSIGESKPLDHLHYDMPISFATGRGTVLPGPSRAALQKAQLLLKEEEDETPSAERSSAVIGDVGDLGPDLKRSRTTSSSLFQTGAGNSIAGPSKSALNRATAIFQDLEEETDLSNQSHRLSTSSPSESSQSVSKANSSLFTSGAGRHIAPPSRAATNAAHQLFADSPNLGDAPPHTPFNKSKRLFVAPSPDFRKESIQQRTPLRPTTNTFSTPRPSTSMFKPIHTTTPTTSRRIGLGLSNTPSASTKSRGFRPPSKRPHSLLASSQTPAQPPRHEVATETKAVIQSVFNITPTEPRSSYRDAFLKPQYLSADELHERGIPSQVTDLDLKACSKIQLPPDGLDWTCAAQHIRRLGCHLAKDQWVQNHWSQVIWKLAGEIQAKPSLMQEKWQYDEVINQLRYRYEREYGQAHRSVLRKLFERDIAPSVPMVLVVASMEEVIRQSAHDEPIHETSLQLSDGWYCMQASIDDTLKRATKKGLLRAGRKISVSGLKLLSSNDGQDPLESPASTTLILRGNACSLAAWDAKLGQRVTPFIASLSSLTVDGGVVPLMDITIVKLFPLAYMNAGSESKGMPWDEAEEAILSEKWEARREAELEQLRQSARERMDHGRHVLSILADRLQTPSTSQLEAQSSRDSIDQLYDGIMDSKEPMMSLRSVPSHRISQLYRHAQTAFAALQEEQQMDIQSKIESICPRRQTRSFRIARIVDARRGDREPCRIGMLNIWDCKDLPADLIREGQRYQISNVMPGRNGDWSLTRPGQSSQKEVYLHTRRETQWRAL